MDTECKAIREGKLCGAENCNILNGDSHALSLAHVVVGAHDGCVSSLSPASLEGRVDHTLASGNVLLIIGEVLTKSSPAVA